MTGEPVTDMAGMELFKSETPQARQKLSFVRQIYQCLAVAVLAVASYFVISHYVLQSVQVIGESMVPTLFDSQQYLLNRWVYYFRAPRPADVVVLRDPVENGLAVKRIIATAGDRVDLRGGRVYVNGRRLDEPYLIPGTPTFPFMGLPEKAFILEKDQYFVLGDNRKNSADSRTYGAVPRRSILGLIVR